MPRSSGGILHLPTYCIHLRKNLSVGEALQVHSTGGTGHGTSTAALAQSIVDSSQTAILTDAVVVDLTDFIGDGAVGADLGTVAAAVTQQLIGFGGAGVGRQLVLGEQANDVAVPSATLDASSMSGIVYCHSLLLKYGSANTEFVTAFTPAG